MKDPGSGFGRFNRLLLLFSFFFPFFFFSSARTHFIVVPLQTLRNETMKADEERWGRTHRLPSERMWQKVSLGEKSCVAIRVCLFVFPSGRLELPLDSNGSDNNNKNRPDTK